MCNCKGSCGCNITQITKGEKGDNGAAGTNAFKFVKEFETEAIDQTINIPYAQWSACGAPPSGCLADGTTANPFVDIHIQLWLFIPLEIGTPNWVLLSNGDFNNTFSYNVKINYLNGNISIVTSEHQGTYRLVILA